jgi:hypothetical protein
MLSRLLVVLGLASLLALPALTLAGCSSSQKRDQYYGTDVGTDFQIPDAVGFPSQAPDAAPPDGAPGDTGLEGEHAPQPDGQVAGAAEVAPDTGLEDVPAPQPDAQIASAADVVPDTGLEDVPVDAPAEDSGPGIDS